jgi:hypothetical protein
MWPYSYPAPPPPCGGGYTAYYPYAGPAYYDPFYWYGYPYPPDAHAHAHEGREPCRFVPLELPVDTATPSRTATVGGDEDVRLSIEYDATAAGARVDVTIENPDGTVLWAVTDFPTGFHSKKHFTTAASGSKLTLEVEGGCSARLKWLEKSEDD